MIVDEKVKVDDDSQITKGYKNAGDEMLYNFVISVIAGLVEKKTYFTVIDRIPLKLAKEIGNIVGFSVKDYGVEIDRSQIEHIWKEHGVNGRSDHSMSDIRDIARVAYIINEFDDVQEGNLSRYKNKDNSLARNVEIKKRIGKDFYYVVLAVPNVKMKRLKIYSMYINKKDTFPAVAMNKNPCRYALDEPQSNVSFDDIVKHFDFYVKEWFVQIADNDFIIISFHK